MAVKIVSGKILPIGVDLGTSSVKLAQLRETDGGHELVAAGMAEIPYAARGNLEARLEFCGEAIRPLMGNHAFRGRQAILSVPAEYTFVRHVRIPRTPPDQVETVVLRELQGKLPFAADDAEIRHIVVSEVSADGEPRQEVIVVAAARATLVACLGMAQRAKLDVVGVNVEPCAIVECFGRLFRRANDQKRTILFIDMGQASTQVVLSHGSQIVFARNVMIAGNHLDKALADKMGVKPEEAWQVRREEATRLEGPPAESEIHGHLADVLDALGDELTQCVRYYESVFRNQNIERAIFLGGQASDKRLCQAIAQRLNLPAQIGDPLVRVDSPSAAGGTTLDRREPQPRWAVAVGLSLGGSQAA
jgi:type IV pilus assembly protein PilM